MCLAFHTSEDNLIFVLSFFVFYFEFGLLESNRVFIYHALWSLMHREKYLAGAALGLVFTMRSTFEQIKYMCFQQPERRERTM